jgi:hypothetical protein
MTVMPEGVGYPEGDMPTEGGNPDAVMEADQMEAEEKAATLGAAAPPPEEPFSTKAIGTLVKELNETIDTFAGEGQEIPDVEFAAEGAGAKWDQPLPEQVYAVLEAMRMAVDQVAGGEFAAKYDFEPAKVVDDVELRKATADVIAMRGDKKLVKAMQVPAEEVPQEAPQAPTLSSDLPEEDQVLVDGMR